MRTIKKRQRGEVLAQTIILMAILVGAGVFYYQKVQAQKSAELSSMPEAGYNWNFYTLEGKTIPFASLKGKTVFLNYFGTWCGPCLTEMPAIQKMYEKVKDRGVEVIVMSSEDAGTLSGYMASNSFTFPMYRFEPPIAPTTEPLAGIPATLIIAPNGKIARIQVGPDAWDSDANVQFILALAKKWPAH